MNARRIFLIIAMLAGLSTFGSSGASAQGVQLFAVLLGGNEVPPADPNGYGTASVIFAGPGRICFSILVYGIDKPIAAHIHEKVAGQNGPIVIPLTPPAAGSPGTSSDCISGLDGVLLARIRNTPSAFYVNVHTGVFDGGALRGQLF